MVGRLVILLGNQAGADRCRRMGYSGIQGNPFLERVFKGSRWESRPVMMIWVKTGWRS